MLSNCILWAYAMKWRRGKRGVLGDVYWRRSRWGPFPHALYGEERNGRTRLVSYKPLNPRHKWIPPPLFRGGVFWGDRHDKRR